MKLKNGLIPLECNRRQIGGYREIEENFLGDTDAAQEFQMKWAGILQDAAKAGTNEYLAARQRWAGQIVSQSIQLMLFTNTIATAMFDVITVEGQDIPAYHLKTIPEVDVTRISAHGFPSAVNKLSSVAQFFPTPYRISTDRIYQYLPSVLTGNPGPDDDINARARYEITQQIEDDLWTLLTASLGTFSNAWVYDTRIQDMPTTNELDLSAEGGLTKNLIQGILAAVDKIPARTGSGQVTGQTVKIRNMFVPSNSVQDLRDWVSVVSSVTGVQASQDADDTISPTLQADMEKNGVMIDSMWGEPLGLQKSKRLMGTSAADWEKYLWIFFNAPSGRLMRWPEETRSFVYDDRLQAGEEGMSIMETIAMDIPSPYTPNFMRVKIKT